MNNGVRFKVKGVKLIRQNPKPYTLNLKPNV